MKFTIIFLVILAGSCSQAPKVVDLTAKSKTDRILVRGYRAGELYRTKKDFLITGNKSFSLEKPGGVHPFIHQYLENPTAFPEVLGVVNRGTYLEISKIECYSAHIGDIVSGYGVIRSGQFKGKEVLLSGVSDFIHGTPYGTMTVQARELLELAGTE